MVRVLVTESARGSVMETPLPVMPVTRLMLWRGRGVLRSASAQPVAPRCILPQPGAAIRAGGIPGTGLHLSAGHNVSFLWPPAIRGRLLAVAAWRHHLRVDLPVGHATDRGPPGR